MPSFLYSWSTEQRVATTVTPSASDAAYPGSNLTNFNPGRPARLSATSGNFVLDFTSATRIDVVALIHTNLDAALANVRIQANATDSWGAPTMSVLFTIPARTQDNQPANPWLDLTTQAGYSSGGFRFWRLVFGTANSANISIGELALAGVKRTLNRGISWGSNRSRIHHGSFDVTDGGLKIGYGFGTRTRFLDAESEPNDTEVRDSLVQWYDSALGDQRPFIVVPNTEENDAWFCKFRESEHTYVRDIWNKNTFPISVEEVGRGVAP